MSNPKFRLILEIETIPEPFGKDMEAVTSMDFYSILTRIIKKSPDVTALKLIKFEKLEVGK